jgi:transcriptional regulator with XRE-family HTH domain
MLAGSTFAIIMEEPFMEEPLMASFKDRLKDLRKSKSNKYTQMQMANQLKILVRTYQMYEYGKREPSISNLIKMAEIFNVSVDYLLGLSDIKNIEAHVSEMKRVLKEGFDKMKKELQWDD